MPAMSWVALGIDLKAEQKCTAFVAQGRLQAGEIATRQQMELPERYGGSQKLRIVAGLPAEFDHLFGPPYGIDRAVFAVRRAGEGEARRQVRIEPVLYLHDVRDIEVQPNRIVIVDHQAQLAGRLQQPGKFAQEALRILDTHQHARAVDVVERGAPDRHTES